MIMLRCVCIAENAGDKTAGKIFTGPSCGLFKDDNLKLEKRKL
jgi:hypothetical protein